MSAGRHPRPSSLPGPARRTVPQALSPTLALLAALAAAAPAAAQETRGCHCVDEDGNEIEGCRCEFESNWDVVVAPRVSIAPLPPHAPTALAWSMAEPRRARLGIGLGDPGEDDVGAPVEEVMEDGPAARAGLQAGDVIVALDGHDLSEPVEGEEEGDVTIRGAPAVPRLLEVLGDLEPGEAVELTYLRDGERRTTTVTLGENPGWERMEHLRARMERMGERMGEMEDLRMDALHERLSDMEAFRFDAEAPRAFVWEGPGESGWSFRGRAPGVWSLDGGRCPGEADAFAFGRNCVAGAELLELNPTLGAYFGAEEGVLVSAVAEDSPLGLRAGDVILAIDGRAVVSPEDARRILRSYAQDEEVTFRILRQRETMDVRGRMER